MRPGSRLFVGMAIAIALSGAGFMAASAKAPEPPAWARYDAPAPVRILGYNDDAMEPFLSRDGATLFFNNRNSPPDKTDLHWAERVDDLTFRYRGRVEGANSPKLDGVATMSAGDRFCYISVRSYFESLATVYCGDWSHGRLENVALQSEAAVRVLGRVVFDIEIDASGRSMILADGLFRGGPVPVSSDLRQARLVDGTFRLNPEDDPLFAAVNSRALEYAAALSTDGLTLSFTRMTGPPPFSSATIWIARRPRASDAFGPPVQIRVIRGFAEAATFTPDGRALYFHRRTNNRFTLWRVSR
ncbi:MAG: hypothetical protein FD160_2324 [Caulobacteraceae bacterium]|nr:MAG: hypothetical protein FD160_2324 [Caulobacteraceae bacterium]